MKKFYLFLFVLFVGVFNAQIVNIPDANFKTKLLSANTTNGIAKNNAGQNIVIDANVNNEIEVSEALSVFGLDFYSYDITDLTGITSFTNLKNVKIGNTPVQNVSFVGLSNLQILEISGFSALQTLDISSFPSLQNLKIIGCDNLSSLNLQNLNSLTQLRINTNSSLNNVVLSNFLALVNLNCTSNNALTNLNISNCPNVVELDLGNNSLTTLNITNLPAVQGIILNNNDLTSIDLSGFPNLTGLSAVENQLTSLDFSNNPLFYGASLANNNLQFINVKNGGQNTPTINVPFNPQLQFVCCDSNDEISIFWNLIQQGVYNVVINSYCSFTPGGTFYTIEGNTQYDSNNNGCDANDPAKSFQNFSITNGTVTGNFIANATGNYSIPVQAGNHTITPVLENPTYFNISPSSLTANFPTQTSPLNQNFCITANGTYNDLEVVIIPVTAAAPGFDAVYKILYKNKGNTTQSGTLSFAYNDTLSDFVSSSLAPFTQTTGFLSWTFSNLVPFETREILVTLNLNAPTDTPPLNGNDVLNFQSIVLAGTDEMQDDNTFDLAQTVVNSFDPNDKTCLEGATIAQTQVGDYVHYLVRFENTGTANAQNIVVKDIIDTTKFDLSSLIALNGSHAFVTRITNPNTVEFIFENIQLPFNDATNDGFVLFKIKTLSTLTLGDTFSNDAEIYFDYNHPIITNDYVTTVQNQLSTSEVAKNSDFKIYPNPVVDILHFQGKEKVEKVEVFDASGRIVFSKGVNRNQVDLSHLQTGNYLIKLFTKDEQFTQKLIKK